MKIISKFHDYYDSALGFGHDEHVVYVRHLEEPEVIPEELKFMEVPKFRGGKMRSKKKKTEHLVYPFTVAFCGKVYRGIGTKFEQGAWGVTKTVSNYFYDEGTLGEYLNKYGLELVVPKKEKGSMRRWLGSYRSAPDSLVREEVMQHYFSEPVSDQHLDFFAARKLPVVVCTKEFREKWSSYVSKDYILKINQSLKGIQFFKVFDAYLAFQELEMFLGGIAAGEDNPMANIDDECLAQAKGFDCYSFKKEPTKKKRKPCR